MCDFFIRADELEPPQQLFDSPMINAVESLLVPGRNWVFVENQDTLQTLLELIHLIAHEQKPVEKIGTAEPFAEQNIWGTRKSYVTRLAQPFFSRLFASGIFTQWKLVNDLRSRALVRSFYLKDPQGTPLRYSHLFVPRLPSKEPHPLTLKHFKIPFIILTAGFLFAALAFIREMAMLFSAAYAILSTSLRIN
jgi:hypothetical protein